MIPVIMDPCMKNVASWEGIMGLTLGTMLYVDMTSDDAPIFEEKCDELFHRVQSLSREKYSLSSVTTLPAAPKVDIQQDGPFREDPPPVVLEVKDETPALSSGTTLKNKGKELDKAKPTWTCSVCKKSNTYDSLNCSSCSTSLVGRSSVAADETEPLWTCVVCETVNGMDLGYCSACASVRRGISSTAVGAELIWTCVVCKKVNSMHATKCPGCFTSRSGKGSAADCFTRDGRYDPRSRHDPSKPLSRCDPRYSHDLSKSLTKNICKICHGPTEKKFFCVKCVEQHEKKTGKKFSGYCNNCLNCRDMTLNDDYCENCVVCYEKSSRDGKAFERRGKISLSSVTTSPVVAPVVDIKQKAALREDPPPVFLQAKDETPVVSSGATLNVAGGKNALQALKLSSLNNTAMETNNQNTSNDYDMSGNRNPATTAAASLGRSGGGTNGVNKPRNNFLTELAMSLKQGLGHMNQSLSSSSTAVEIELWENTNRGITDDKVSDLRCFFFIFLSGCSGVFFFRLWRSS
jgi:hypothetical protein